MQMDYLPIIGASLVVALIVTAMVFLARRDANERDEPIGRDVMGAQRRARLELQQRVARRRADVRPFPTDGDAA